MARMAAFPVTLIASLNTITSLSTMMTLVLVQPGMLFTAAIAIEKL